jgi:hypothetical protein
MALLRGMKSKLVRVRGHQDHVCLRQRCLRGAASIRRRLLRPRIPANGLVVDNAPGLHRDDLLPAPWRRPRGAKTWLRIASTSGIRVAATAPTPPASVDASRSMPSPLVDVAQTIERQVQAYLANRTWASSLGPARPRAIGREGAGGWVIASQETNLLDHRGTSSSVSITSSPISCVIGCRRSMGRFQALDRQYAPPASAPAAAGAPACGARTMPPPSSRPHPSAFRSRLADKRAAMFAN